MEPPTPRATPAARSIRPRHHGAGTGDRLLPISRVTIAARLLWRLGFHTAAPLRHRESPGTRMNGGDDTGSSQFVTDVLRQLGPVMPGHRMIGQTRSIWRRACKTRNALSADSTSCRNMARSASIAAVPARTIRIVIDHITRQQRLGRPGRVAGRGRSTC